MAQNPEVVYAANTLQGQPYAADSRVALGDEYLGTHETAVGNPIVEERDRERALERMIIDKAPEPWMASLKLMMMKAPVEISGLTDEWPEMGLGIAGVEIDTGAAQQAGAPNTTVTQSVTITSGTQDNIGLDTILGYPGSEIKGVVTAKTGTSITITGLFGDTLPALNPGDTLTNEGQLRGDAMDRIAHVSRTTQSYRYNFIQTLLTAKRWGGDELQELKNQLRTDRLIMERKRMVQDHRILIFKTFMDGRRGAAILSGGENARTTAGIFPQMIEAGAFYDSVTTAGFKAAFEYGAFNTMFKNQGSTKLVIGRSAALNLFQETYKMFLTRYQNGPNDRNINLDLNSIVLGGNNYVLTPCDIFAYSDVFGEDWRNRLLVVDLDNVNFTKLRGKYFMNQPVTTDTLMQGDGSLRDYHYDLLFSKFGVRHAFAENSFALDISDLVN